jgi:ABC-2 type transport system ATP-binding protein
MTTNAIKLTNVTKKYGDRKVINNLSFEVAENTICGFLGLNGAGKTTTFKLLAGLINATSGKIDISPDIKFLQDVPEFYDYMTAEEYLKFICNLNNLNDISKKVKETLKLVGLHDTGKKRIGKFSRGMKQRMGIAGNIISNPKILLLDEPVSALDPMGRRQVFDLLEKLRGKMTILFSTHIIDDVERVSDKIIIINHGKKVADGTTTEIRSKFLTDMIEVQFMNNDDQQKFVKAFGKKEVEIGQGSVRIKTRPNLQTEVFNILKSEKINIEGYNIVMPTLEDIFMKEVKK